MKKKKIYIIIALALCCITALLIILLQPKNVIHFDRDVQTLQDGLQVANEAIDQYFPTAKLVGYQVDLNARELFSNDMHPVFDYIYDHERLKKFIYYDLDVKSKKIVYDTLPYTIVDVIHDDTVQNIDIIKMVDIIHKNVEFKYLNYIADRYPDSITEIQPNEYGNSVRYTTNKPIIKSNKETGIWEFHIRDKKTGIFLFFCTVDMNKGVLRDQGVGPILEKDISEGKFDKNKYKK